MAVNYAPNQSQCYVHLPLECLDNGQYRLEDLMGDATYGREGNELASRGLFLDLHPWQFCVFSVTKCDNIQ